MCYHPLFVFNQDGDLERCALRPGNVHSAHGWHDVLDPVVARYRGQALRRLLRGDAAFALPDVYEYLEAEGFQYTIRLPANQVLQAQIANLLTRPVGRPPHYVPRRFYASFRYQAQSWSRARRVVAKVEWHPGELYPRVGFIVTNLHRSARRVVAFYNGRGTDGTVHQGGEARDQVDAAVVHDLPGQRRPAPTARAGVQPRQLPAYPGAAERDRTLVPDHAAGEGGQDRREGDRPRPLRDLPDGGGGGAAGAVRSPPGADRKAASTCHGATLSRTSRSSLPVQGRGASAAGPTPARRAREGAWRAASAALRPDSSREGPEIACRPRPPATTSIREPGFSPVIWEMSVESNGRPPAPVEQLVSERADVDSARIANGAAL